MLRWQFLVWCLVSIACSAQNANITGIWAGEEKDDKGVVRDVAFRLIQQGNKISGAVYYDHKFGAYVNTDIQLENGTRRGDKLRFVIRSVGYTGKIVMAYFGEVKPDGSLEIRRQRIEQNSGSKTAAADEDTEWETPTKGPKLILRRKT
jgi:hypothetical protein